MRESSQSVDLAKDLRRYLAGFPCCSKMQKFSSPLPQRGNLDSAGIEPVAQVGPTSEPAFTSVFCTKCRAALLLRSVVAPSRRLASFDTDVQVVVLSWWQWPPREERGLSVWNATTASSTIRRRSGLTRN